MSRRRPVWGALLAVVLVNAAVLGHHLARGDWRVGVRSALSALAGLTLVNFARRS